MPDDNPAVEAPQLDTPDAQAKQLAEESDRQLDTLMSEAEEKDAARAERDAKGRFLPKKSEEKQDPTEVAKEVMREDDEPAEPEESPYSEGDQQKALKALQRYKASKSILDAATKGDTETIEYGLHIAQIQADYDERNKERKAIADELADLKKRGTTTQDTEDGKGDTAPAIDVDALAKPLAKHLEDVTGEDLSEHIRTSFAGLVEAVSKAHLKDKKASETELTSLREKFERLEIDRARDALISDYPQLKDKQTWEKVVAQMNDLPESESRPDTLTRLDHAARIELAPEIAKQAKTERAARNKSRDNGSPDPPGRVTPEKSRSEYDIQDEMLDAKMEGNQQRYESLKAELDSRT